jgi:hypothetical protein
MYHNILTDKDDLHFGNVTISDSRFYVFSVSTWIHECSRNINISSNIFIFSILYKTDDIFTNDTSMLVAFIHATRFFNVARQVFLLYSTNMTH